MYYYKVYLIYLPFRPTIVLLVLEILRNVSKKWSEVLAKISIYTTDGACRVSGQDIRERLIQKEFLEKPSKNTF